MPKREPTPPPGDDEPKYFSINYPYPLHANMEIPEDRKVVARWLSCCVPKEHLFALYHKPTAPNTIIIEVARDSPQIPDLLGAHKWIEFLKNPTDEERDKETRVFYCLFSTGREVQKIGWKRIDVDDTWFENFATSNNKDIVHPYPKSHYCDPPKENQTGYTLCRPLPKRHFQLQFQKPKAGPKMPPGSKEWQAARNKGAQKVKGPQPLMSAKSTGSWASIVTGRSGAPPIKFSYEAGVSRAPSQLSQARSLSDDSSEYSVNIIGSYAAAGPPALVTSGDDRSVGSTGERISPLSMDDSENEDDMLPKLSDVVMVSSASDEFDGSEMRALSVVDVAWDNEVMNNSNIGRLNGTNEDEEGRGNGKVVVNLWTGTQPSLNKSARHEAPVCTVHGVVCRKGICAEYKKQLNALEREKEKAERGEGFVEGKKGRGRGAWRGRGRGGAPPGRDNKHESSTSSRRGTYGSSSKPWQERPNSEPWNKASKSNDNEENANSRQFSQPKKRGGRQQSTHASGSKQPDTADWGSSPLEDPIEPLGAKAANDWASSANDESGWY